jgi:hypothetical protein
MPKVSRAYTASSLAVKAPVAAAVPTTAATNTSPYGFSQAQADALITAVNALIADLASDKQVLNAVIDELQARSLL